MLDYDSPWKEMLDGYFPAFMAFFFPEAYADIDWVLTLPAGLEARLQAELVQ
jgi:hypothetical protein